MDSSDPEICIQADGTCNHCNHYFMRAEKEILVGVERDQRLAEMVEKIKRTGAKRDYDCIIGISGGVDSTAVAYHVKRLGLRPLAVHLDNGWNSELAVDNIKKTLDVLGVDLYTHVIDWSEFRDLQLSFLKASVPNCEIPTDHAISALMITMAMKTGARFVLTGSNLATEGIMPHAWGYYNQDLKHIRAIHRQFGSVPLKTFPQLGIAKYLWAVLGRGVRFVPFLNYVDYNKDEAKAMIQRELGWRDYGGKHFESIYTRFFQGWILPKKFGYDKRRAHLSTLICSGQVTREEALAEMEQDPYPREIAEADREYVIKKLGLTEESFDRIIAAPPKLHASYPSNKFFYHDLHALKQAFKRIATRV